MRCARATWLGLPVSAVLARLSGRVSTCVCVEEREERESRWEGAERESRWEAERESR
jgi:hypothetical protein